MTTELQEVIAIIDSLFTICARTVVVQYDDLRLLVAAAKECDRLREANAELVTACRAMTMYPLGDKRDMVKRRQEALAKAMAALLKHGGEE